MRRAASARYRRCDETRVQSGMLEGFTPFVVASNGGFNFAGPNKGVNFAEVGAVGKTANLAEV